MAEFTGYWEYASLHVGYRVCVIDNTFNLNHIYSLLKAFSVLKLNIDYLESTLTRCYNVIITTKMGTNIQSVQS